MANGEQGIPISDGFTLSKDDDLDKDRRQATLAAALGNIPPERRYSGKEIFVLEAGNRGTYHMNATLDGWEQFGADAAETHLSTGVITGGNVSINADPTKFDVSAGTGVIIDWTDPSNPVRTIVSWNAFIAQSVPDLATELFTTLAINNVSGLVVVSGVESTPELRRTTIRLQNLVHVGGTQIEQIDQSSQPAYDIPQSLLDYIIKLGPLNTGNRFSSNGANLKIDKSSGETSLPFINRENNSQAPTTLASIAVSPATFSTVYQDGGGGFTITGGIADIDPTVYDNGSGVLQAVANNKWTVQRIYFFARSGDIGVTYGQAVYDSLIQAEIAIFEEEPIISPIFELGIFVTALIVKKEATDLGNIAEAKFVNITAHLAGGGEGAITTAPAGNNQEVQFNNSGIFGASDKMKWLGSALSIITGSGYSINDSGFGYSIVGPGGSVMSLVHSQLNGANFILTEDIGDTKQIQLTSEPTLQNFILRVLGLGTETPNQNSQLDIESTTKGFLAPRMTTAQKTTLGALLGSGDKGMEIYDTDTLEKNIWNGTTWDEIGAGSPMLNATIQLTQSQIQALNTTPIEVIAAPGAGKYIQVLGSTAFLNHNGTDYTVASILQLQQGVGKILWQANNCIDESANSFVSFNRVSTGVNNPIIPDNANLEILLNVDASGNGGTVDIDVQYKIIDTN